MELAKSMVEIFDTQEASVDELCISDVGTSPRIALALYFLAGVALELVFSNQDYGVGAVPGTWRSVLLQRELIARYADRLLAVAQDSTARL